MNPHPHLHRACVGLLWAAASAASIAGQGLASPNPQTWWPQWQARLSLQSAPIGPAGLSGPLAPLSAAGSSGATRGVQGGALLGDYYFANPSLGQFRASGGLMLGQTGGAPLAAVAGSATAASALSRLGFTVLGGGGLAPRAWGSDSHEPTPYLGLGYSGSLWGDSVSLSADLGLVYERPSGAAGSRALFGNQGANQWLRDMRMAPVMQLGMRYTF